MLRARHLSLSVHKTKLLHGAAVLREFEDERKDAITYLLKVEDPTARRELRALFNDAVAHEPVNARDVRYAVVRLADLGDPHAVPWILEHFVEVPYLASHLVDYLSVYVGDMPEIEERTRRYLRSSSENIYPWSELHLVRMFSKAESISDETQACMWEILKDQNKQRLVRDHAARCVGRHARPGDTALLKDLFAASSDHRLKRALLVGVTEARRAAGPDKAWLGSVAKTTPTLAHTCRYLRSQRTLPAP